MTTPTYFIPIWNGTQFFDKNGNILAGGQIFQYEGGSYTANQTTYQGTDDSTSPNTNPIVLDSNGRSATQMWGQQGLYYNLRLTDSNGNIIDSEPNILGTVGSSVPTNSNVGVNVWNTSAAPTFVSGTTVLIPGNVVDQYAIGNRVRFTNGTDTLGYGTVTSVSFTSPNTQIVIQPDSTVIGSNVTAFAWSSLVANGITVDAAGVSYATEIPYTNLGTVGGQIAALDTSVAAILTPSGVTAGGYYQANIVVNDLGVIVAATLGMPLTTKGDLEVFAAGPEPTRIGVGVDGTVLTANSSDANGMTWEAPFNAALTNGATADLVRTGTSGVIADPSMVVALAANVVYNFEVKAFMFSPSAGVFMGLGFSGTVVKGCWSVGGTAEGGGNNNTFSINTNGTFASGIDHPSLLNFTGTIYTSTPGNLYLVWGNGGAGGNTMTRYASSGIVATEVA